MKLEIDLPEEKIKNAIACQAISTIARQINEWGSLTYIKGQVKQHWNAAIKSTIERVIGDHDELREMVARSVETLVRAQVRSALEPKVEAKPKSRTKRRARGDE